MWDYEFFKDSEESEPVKDFLLSLSNKHRAKVLQFIQILSEFGPNLPFPYSSQVEGKIRELRAHFGKTQYRVLYYQDSEGAFVLLHAFEKKTSKIPQRETNIAKERMAFDQKKKCHPE